jgi:hypothetical protein
MNINLAQASVGGVKALCQGMTGVPSGSRAVKATKQTGALQAAEKLIRSREMCQGTTSVVP